MLHERLKRHTYKIVVGVPMVVLLASSLSLIRDPEQMCVVPEDNRFVEVGEKVTLLVRTDADEPVNVFGGTVHVPRDMIEITGVSRERSLIDLWSEEPLVSEDGSTVHFSGGVVSRDGFTGNGILLEINVVPLVPGEAEIRFDDVTMLAHDGTGREVDCSKGPITLSVRPVSYPSPDVNNDKQVNIFDFGIVSARLFMAYNDSYDLNQDGKINLSDIGIVLVHMTGAGKMGSLALLATY